MKPKRIGKVSWEFGYERIAKLGTVSASKVKRETQPPSGWSSTMSEIEARFEALNARRLPRLPKPKDVREERVVEGMERTEFAKK
jgi:hypothetical protein